MGSKAIAIVSPDEVVRTRKICPPAPQRCDSFVVAAFTKDGTRVLGAFDTYEGRPVSPWGEVDAR